MHLKLNHKSYLAMDINSGYKRCSWRVLCTNPVKSSQFLQLPSQVIWPVVTLLS
jgi:hypothetical protein